MDQNEQVRVDRIGGTAGTKGEIMQALEDSSARWDLASLSRKTSDK